MTELTDKQIKKLHLLLTVLKNMEDIPKPPDVEAAITPFYNWLESLLENKEEYSL